MKAEPTPEHMIEILTAALKGNAKLIAAHAHDRRKYAADLVAWYECARNCRRGIKEYQAEIQAAQQK